MIEHETKQTVAKYLGLKLLQRGKHTQYDIDRNITGVIHVSFLWLAEVPRFRRLTSKGHRNLLVAVIKTLEWRKGILLIPEDVDNGNDNEYIGGDSLMPVELTHDPVEETLNCLNLTYTGNYEPGIIRYSENAHTIHLFVQTNIIFTEMSVGVRHWDEAEDHKKLWGSIKSVIFDLCEKHDVGDMRGIIESKLF